MSEHTINKMLQQQKEDNAKLLSEPMVRQETDIQPADMGETIKSYSCTDVRQVGDVMQLCRFINSKLYRVEFNTNVLLVDIQDYFTLDDYTFRQLGVRS